MCFYQNPKIHFILCFTVLVKTRKRLNVTETFLTGMKSTNSNYWLYHDDFTMAADLSRKGLFDSSRPILLTVLYVKSYKPTIK